MQPPLFGADHPRLDIKARGSFQKAEGNCRTASRQRGYGTQALAIPSAGGDNPPRLLARKATK